MFDRFQQLTVNALRWSERYTRTDMVYVAGGISWLFVGQAVAVLFSLSLAVAFGHLATQDAYGNYKYVLSVAALIGAFSLSGIGTAVIQAVARGNEGALRQSFRLNFRWSWGLVGAAAIAAGYYSIVQHNPFLGAACALVALSLPFLNGFGLFYPFLIGKSMFKKSTVYAAINNAVPTLALIITLFVTQRAIILVAVFFLASICSSGLFYLLTLRQAHNATEDPELLSYGLHLSAMNIINTIADRIDSIVVFSLLGPSQLAVYAFALAVPEQIKAVFKSLIPLSMAKFAQRSVKEIRLNIWRRIGILMLASAGIILMYIAIAPWLFATLFPAYIESIPYSQWYVLSLLFTIIPMPLSALFQAHKKTSALHTMTNGGSLSLIIALPILTYLYGINGALASQFIYRIITTLLALWQFRLLK